MTKRSSLAKEFRFHHVNQIRVDEWADSFRWLPTASAASGRWRTVSVELARGPMRAFDEPGVRFLTLCFAVQVGKTETILNIIGRSAHLDPAPMMVVYRRGEGD
jgi:phage terminase large subunit GpA-like protein